MPDISDSVRASMAQHDPDPDAARLLKWAASREHKRRTMLPLTIAASVALVLGVGAIVIAATTRNLDRDGVVAAQPATSIALSEGAVVSGPTAGASTAEPFPNADPASSGSSEADGQNQLAVNHRTFALTAAHQVAKQSAVGRNEQQDSGWPSGITAVTASIQSVTATDSNTGHTCESGTIISVRLFGAFDTFTAGIPLGTGTSSPDNTVREIDLRVDATTGLTCLISVRVKPVPQSPAETVLYSR